MEITQPGIFIIPDGNRRWAKEKGRDFEYGYSQFEKIIPEIIKTLQKKNIKKLYFWCNSINNLKRSKKEVNSYFNNYLKIEKFAKNNRIKIILKGNPQLFPGEFYSKFKELESKTKNNKDFYLYYFLNYDTIDDLKRAKEKSKEKSLNEILKQMDEPEDIDIIIRTGGNNRLSGLTPIKNNNTHIYFIGEFFPELNEKKIEKIIENYRKIKMNDGK